MSATTLKFTVHRRRWAAVGGGAAIAVVIGLLCVEPFPSNATGAQIAATRGPIAEPSIAAPEAATLPIIPSAVIATDTQLFYGTGDGSNGFYR